MKITLKFVIAAIIFIAFSSTCVSQINKDENEPEETKQVLVDFQHYVVRAIQYPSKANKNSIQKTLYYTLKVNGNNTVSDFVRIDSIPESEQNSVFPLYFTAPSSGKKGIENPDYDKDFESTVEKAAKRFNKYKTTPEVNYQTVYFSFNFIVK